MVNRNTRFSIFPENLQISSAVSKRNAQKIFLFHICLVAKIFFCDLHTALCLHRQFRLFSIQKCFKYRLLRLLLLKPALDHQRIRLLYVKANAFPVKFCFHVFPVLSCFPPAVFAWLLLHKL